MPSERSTPSSQALEARIIAGREFDAQSAIEQRLVVRPCRAETNREDHGVAAELLIAIPGPWNQPFACFGPHGFVRLLELRTSPLDEPRSHVIGTEVAPLVLWQDAALVDPRQVGPEVQPLAPSNGGLHRRAGTFLLGHHGTIDARIP